MPPKDKKASKTVFKAGILPKDIIPSQIKNLPRDGKQIRRPQEVIIEPKNKFYQQYPSLEEWPGDEVAKNFDFGVNSDKAFKQSENINVQQYFLPSKDTSQIQWLRPKEINLELSGSDKQDFQIFSIAERDETIQEFEERKRIEEEEKKKQKKQTKKDESSVEDAPKKIKYCVQDNINLSGIYPLMSRWIASCFQLINDTGIVDVNNKEKLFNKIYPQNNEGIPIYNPSGFIIITVYNKIQKLSFINDFQTNQIFKNYYFIIQLKNQLKQGRYWVKLYFRGKLRKIEIDDRFLFFNKSLIFPKSLSQYILWPMLFTKALMKLQENNWDPQLEKNNNHCEGFVIYSLTGMLPEIVQIKDFNLENFQYIKKQLSDTVYDSKDTIISCFKVDKNPEANKNQLSNYMIQSCDNSEESSLNTSQISQKDVNIQGVINSSRKGKKNSIEIGGDQGIEKNKQSEKSNNVINSVQYYLIESFFNENFNMVYVKERNEDEIKLRQDYFNLCKQNIHKLSKEEKLEHRRLKKEQKEKINEEERKRQELITKPPVQYRLFSLKSRFEKVSKLKFKCSFTSKEIFIAKKCIINKLSKPPNYDITDVRGNDAESQTVINQDKSFEIKPLDEFNLPNIIDPKERSIKGSWIQDYDIVNHFDYIILYHNDNKFPKRQFISAQNSVSEEFTKDENSEVLVIGEDNDQKIIELFISFQSNMVCNQQGMTIMPQFILQKYDFNNFELIQNIKTINRQFDGFCLNLEKGVHVFRLQTIAPVGYSLWINSNTGFQTMSIQQYITKYLKFIQKSFIIEHITGEKDFYQIFGKFKITCQDKAELYVRVKSQAEPDPFITKHLRLKLVKDNQNQENVMLQGMEGVEKNQYTQTYLNITDYNKLVLQNSNYNLVLEGQVPFNVSEGKIDIEFFSKEEIQIEQLDFVEPLEYFDKYIPNKIGLIFSERIFVPETVYCSFNIQLVKVVQSGVSKDAKDTKKGVTQGVEQTESELQPQRLIKMELFDEDRLICSVSGMNYCWISDVMLPKTDRNYYLKASFDLREWPECKILSEETKDIQWYLRTNGATQTVVLIKDTQKEEREKAIQKSWEDKEPGRAEKAKRARKKYKALLKKEAGEQLDAEEQALLNEPRVSKKQKEEIAKQAGQQKGKAPPAKKDAKKGGPEEVVEVKQVIVNFPKSSDHHMEEITQFLERLESEIVKHEYGQHQGEINIRTQNEYKELLERLSMSTEDFNSQLLRNLNQRDKMKLYQINLIEQEIMQQEQLEKENQEKYKTILETRSQYKEEWVLKKNIKKQMLDIYTKEKPTISEIQQVIQNAEETHNQEQLEIGQMLLNNAKIYQVLDELAYGVDNFELDKIDKNVDLIQQYKINVDLDLLEKAYEIIDESKINPKYCEDKLNEVKKGGKKTKK